MLFVWQIEVILKLIATPEDMLVERFRMMWPDGEAKDLQVLFILSCFSKLVLSGLYSSMYDVTFVVVVCCAVLLMPVDHEPQGHAQNRPATHP